MVGAWWEKQLRKMRGEVRRKKNQATNQKRTLILVAYLPSPFISRPSAVYCVINSRYYQHSDALALVVIVCMLKLVPSNLLSQHKIEGRATEKTVAAGAFLYLLQETRTASLSAAFSHGRRTRCRFRSLRKDAGEVEKRDPRGLPQFPFD